MIYILHFDRKFSKRHTTQHYVGYCKDGRLSERIKEHRSGKGAAITRAARKKGIGFSVAATMPGDRAEERRIKSNKNTPRMCPICKGKDKDMICHHEYKGDWKCDACGKVLEEYCLECGQVLWESPDWRKCWADACLGELPLVLIGGKNSQNPDTLPSSREEEKNPI